MSTKTKLRLKKIKGTTNILHVDSNLVLKSLEDKIIIGKYVDDEVQLLSSSDVELCKEWNFTFDDERVSKDEEEDMEEDNEEENQEDMEEENQEDNEEDKEEENQDEKNEEDKEEVEQKSQDIETDNKINIPEQVIVQEKENDEYVHISETPKPTHILDITEQFAKDIHNHFDLLTHHYTDKITNYENKISSMNYKYNELFKTYTIECDEHNNTKNELQKLKTKFEGIKSLFN